MAPVRERELPDLGKLPFVAVLEVTGGAGQQVLDFQPVGGLEPRDQFPGRRSGHGHDELALPRNEHLAVLCDSIRKDILRKPAPRVSLGHQAPFMAVIATLSRQDS